MPQCLDRGLVGLKAEPFEVVEDGGLEVVAGTPAVVVFDAEQHPAVVAAGQSPHVDRVYQVSQVEEPCGCRRKPGDRRVVDGWGDGAMGEWFGGRIPEGPGPSLPDHRSRGRHWDRVLIAKYADKPAAAPPGGLRALNEIATAAGVGMVLEERAFPIPGPVEAACEMLGLDPLYMANEGVLVALIAADAAEQALEVMRAHQSHT